MCRTLKSMHRILLGAHDLMDVGTLAFHGSTEEQSRPAVRVTGAGVLTQLLS